MRAAAEVMPDIAKRGTALEIFHPFVFGEGNKGIGGAVKRTGNQFDVTVALLAQNE